MNLSINQFPHDMAPAPAKSHLSALTLTEAHHLWRISHRKGVIPQEPPKSPPPVSEIVELLERQDYNTLIMVIAADPNHISYNIMEKLIAKPIYMAARGETGLELRDNKNRPIITPRGSYRGIPMNTPLKFAREYEEKKNKNKTLVDNRIVTAFIDNPKKPNTETWRHYQQYTLNKSVSWHVINTDLTRADIRHDISKEFVTVVTPAEFATLQQEAQRVA